MQRWEAQEAHVAGWVGLAVAASSGRRTCCRRSTTGARRPASCWTASAAGGCASRRRAHRHHHARRRRPGGDRAGLLEDGVVTSAVPTSRSGDLDRPVLRVSTAAWVTDADLDRLAEALSRRSK
jgi:selenocysteine lyase/cysteine desulfurase